MTSLSLVQVDKNVKTTGLVRVTFVGKSAAARTFLQKIAALNGTWDSFLRPRMEAELKAKTGRTVVLLNGNYVKQVKGAVSYHGTLKVPGSIYLPRKGYEPASGTFFMWVIIK